MMLRQRSTFHPFVHFTLAAFLWSSIIWPATSLAQAPTPAPTPGQTPATEPAPAQTSEAGEVTRACDQGEADAKSGHSGAGFGIGGFFCGVFGLIFAYSSNPQVPAEKLLGKSPDYVSAYTRCYRQEAKSKNIRASLYGWGAAVVVWTIILVASSSSSTTE